MTKKEIEKLEQTIAYFGHWYDVIGEERVLILEKSIRYITKLEKENAELKKINSETLTQLNLDKGELIIENEKLLKELRCCAKCKHYNMNFLPYWCTKNNIVKHCNQNCEYWELKDR